MGIDAIAPNISAFKDYFQFKRLIAFDFICGYPMFWLSTPTELRRRSFLMAWRKRLFILFSVVVFMRASSQPWVTGVESQALYSRGRRASTHLHQIRPWVPRDIFLSRHYNVLRNNYQLTPKGIAYRETITDLKSGARNLCPVQIIIPN